MKKAVVIIPLIVFLIISIVVLALVLKIPSQAGIGSNTFIKPQWARLECSPTDAYEGKEIKWLDQQTLFKCDKNTEECRFSIIDDPQVSCINPLQKLQGYYRICDLNGNNCGAKTQYITCGGTMTNYVTFPSGKSVKFDTGLLIVGERNTKITFEWKPWQLYRYVGGSKFVVNSGSCAITSFAKSNILLEDKPITDTLYRTGGEGTKWVNYVNDWVYGPATNIVNYNGQQAYCSSGKVFSIIKVQVADGSIKQVDPNYVGTKPDGTTLSGLGNVIANVECCPNEPSCGSDFKYIKAEDTTKQCVSDIQCFNAGGPVPISQTSYVKYQCVDNICVKSSPITVQCTNSAQCNNGEVCDLSTTNYGNCIKPDTGEYCGDKICQLTESPSTCSADCGSPLKECSFGESYREAKTGTFLGIFDKQAGCYTSGWVYFTIGIIIILVIIGGIIIYYKIRS